MAQIHSVMQGKEEEEAEEAQEEVEAELPVTKRWWDTKNSRTGLAWMLTFILQDDTRSISQILPPELQ